MSQLWEFEALTNIGGNEVPYDFWGEGMYFWRKSLYDRDPLGEKDAHSDFIGRRKLVFGGK